MGLAALLSVGCGSDDAGSPGGAGGNGGSGGTGGGSTGDPYYDAVPAERLPGAASACPAGFESPVAAGQHQGFSAAGQARSFLLALPGAEYAGPRPLFVLFNGTGETGQAIYDRAQAADFVQRGFIVLAPDSNANGTVWPVWDGMRQAGHENDPNADLDYVDALIDCMAVHFEVDRNRIYVGGHSAGGIFTNHVLQRRSQLLAGGIAASGVFDLTSPSPKAELDAMSVLVTWGGDNDAYSGSTSTGVTVPKINFVEQAAIASAFYEGSAKVEQSWCRGADLGHAWLSPANGWMVDYLLAHPKGLAKDSPWQLTQPGGVVTCGTDAAPPPVGTSVICAPSSTAGCQGYCQFVGDCVAENATLEPALGPQLDAFGFSGANHGTCSSCTTQCETDSTVDATDAAVLSCFDKAFASAQCGPGIAGAQPFIDAINDCCKDKTASGVCKRACGSIKTNSVAVTFFPTCAAF